MEKSKKVLKRIVKASQAIWLFEQSTIRELTESEVYQMMDGFKNSIYSSEKDLENVFGRLSDYEVKIDTAQRFTVLMTEHEELTVPKDYFKISEMIRAGDRIYIGLNAVPTDVAINDIIENLMTFWGTDKEGVIFLKPVVDTPVLLFLIENRMMGLRHLLKINKPTAEA